MRIYRMYHSYAVMRLTSATSTRVPAPDRPELTEWSRVKTN